MRKYYHKMKNMTRKICENFVKITHEQFKKRKLEKTKMLKNRNLRKYLVKIKK